MQENRPGSAFNLATFLIREQLAAGRTIDKLQLQKLLYLVQGAHLELWNTPAYREPTLAYREGPVVATVEQSYRELAEGATPLAAPITDKLPTAEVCETALVVLEIFGTWSGPRLARFVKRQGTPWRMARGDLPPSASSSNVIDLNEIRAWFRRHGVRPGVAKLTGREKSAFERLADGDAKALEDLVP